MLEPKEVNVNGRRYIVNPFNPMAAFDFYHEYTAAHSSGASLSALAKKAIGQCYDFNNRDLSQEHNFQACFSEHPEDMFLLEKVALESLTDPFVKKL